MNIIRGPKSYRPLPEHGLGVQLYTGLSQHSSENCNRIALIDATTKNSITYDQLLRSTVQLARAMKNAGYRESDVISMYSENNLEFFIPVIASLYLGITVAPLNFTYNERELIHAFSITRPKIVFVSPLVYERVSNVLGTQCPWIERVVLINCKVSPKRDILTLQEFIETFNNGHTEDHFEPLSVDSKHLSSILFSSGTTGLPKGVMLSHENILVRFISTVDPRYNEVIKHENKLGFLPFFHGYGFIMSLSNLYEGDTIVVMNKFQEDLFLKSIEEYKITTLYIVPPIIIFLSKSPLVDKYDLSSLKKIFCGAAPLDKQVEILVKQRLNIGVLQGYGLTEATQAIIHFPHPCVLEKPGSIGILLPEMNAVIRDCETGKFLGPNVPGELCFKGPMVMLGYKDNPESTAESFTDDGWLLTGDIAYYDQDEYFYIVDRRKELIKYKSFQVAPAELEAILITHPLVKDAAVIGIADEKAGELPLAFVVRQSEGLSEQQVQKFIEERVSNAKRLRGGVKFVESIPKNPSGKILRRELRAQIIKLNSTY